MPIVIETVAKGSSMGGTAFFEEEELTIMFAPNTRALCGLTDSVMLKGARYDEQLV